MLVNSSVDKKGVNVKIMLCYDVEFYFCLLICKLKKKFKYITSTKHKKVE